jgi:hypothetical protein
MEPKSRKWLVQKTLVVSAALLLTCGLAALVPGVPGAQMTGSKAN